MNDRLKTIVDLENYPIHDLSSIKIKKGDYEIELSSLNNISPPLNITNIKKEDKTKEKK